MITIIGAGPAGSHAAYLLAKAGKSVRVIEEHEIIGTPVQCAGIVTPELLNFIKPKKGVVVNRVEDVVLHGGKKSLKLKLREKNLVLDRACLDMQLAEMAKQAGAEYLLSTRVEGLSKTKTGYVIDTNKGRLTTEVLIGADGPLSIVAKQLGLYRNTRFLKTKQFVVKRKNQNNVEFFLKPHGFAWIVPESRETVRAGIATLESPFQAFESFRKILELGEPIAVQGGLIPLFSLFGRRQIGNCCLIGDAGGFTKATTGGGIVQSLISAKACAQSILHGTPYNILWPLRLATELSLHNLAASVLRKRAQRDPDEFISRLAPLKPILESGSRDNLLLMAIKLFFAEPRLFFTRKNL